ncbi:hypothetical protein FF041_13880 [Streptomyces jumonjinensis]|uniref:Uncharacterized protein n=1 Tax=Streptomyces jumonjinensis TaxID=1945 RepID=A0A646KG62_STRJU|nr:hypothetical protein [Streptomyces jumonjinensis]
MPGVEERTELQDRTMTVDGETFAVHQRPKGPPTYDFTWLTGPNEGYGFTSAVHGSTAPLTGAELEEAARGFLEEIDPATGFLSED